MTLFKQAFRQLAMRPGFSGTVIAMLALGVGAATAIFSLFYQVLVQPLPVPSPERLVNIVRAGPEPVFLRGAFSYATFRDLERGQTVFTDVAAYASFTANVTKGAATFSAESLFVSGGYFRALSLKPAVGRLIGPQDESGVGASPVVVLSHGLWLERFGGDTGVVGRALTVNGRSMTIIGVAPAAFSGTQVGAREQIFAPLTMRWRLDTVRPSDTPEARDLQFLALFARLRPDVTALQAAAGLNTVYSRIRREIEPQLRAMPKDDRRIFARPVELLPGARGQGSIPGAARSLTLLLGVTLLVLLIVCVNVANLFLVRGAARTGEMAIRESMGAKRGRLLAELLAETAAPAVLGGLLALPVAAMTLDAVKPILPARLAAGLGMQVGATAIAFAGLATVTSVLLFGLFPALKTARTDPAIAIKGHASRVLGGQAAPRLRAGLVTAQIAFSMVLLVLAGLFAQSLRNVARIDLGMAVDSIVSFSVSPRLNGYDDEHSRALIARVERALAVQPGVTSVATAQHPVIGPMAAVRAALQVEGFDDGGHPAVASFDAVGPSFFRTLGITRLAGRDFVAADTVGSPRVAIVNERFAHDYGLDGDAIGKHFKERGSTTSLEIVGVVANSAYWQVKTDVPPQYFLPSNGRPSSFFYLRTSLDPEAFMKTIARVVARIDPTVPVDNLITMRRRVQENVFVDRLVSILSAGFAGLATLLAAIGLYGVMAYSVAARTRELGLRLALGAEPSRLRRMISKQVGWMALIGLSVGLGGAIGLGRVAEAQLYGLSGHDPRVLVAAATVLAGVVLAATYWPARQASRIAPMKALRYE